MNKRNHPYYAMHNAAPVEETQNIVPAYPSNVEATPYVKYKPRSTTPWSPRWINNQDFVDNLANFKSNEFYNPNTYGYHVDGIGYLHNDADPTCEARGGAIAAVAIASDVEDPNNIIASKTILMNTEDYGLRHVIFTDNFVKDFGPVESTCIIGNIDRPEGVYVPMCNTRAMADGIILLEQLLSGATKDDADMPPVERVACPYYIPADPVEE